MSWSRNARHTHLGIPDRGPPTNEVSDMTSIHSEQDIHGDEETSGGSHSRTAKGYPIVDDQGAATAVGSSSGKSTAQEQSRANTLQAKAPASGQDKGKGLATEPSGPRTQVPPTLAANSRSRPITASDIKALVENINQKIDGMATRLLTIEQHVSVAPQHLPQPPVREHPFRDNPHSGTSVRQWPSIRQPRPYTSGVRLRSSSTSQTTRSNEEDLYDYRDPWEPEMDHLEDDNHNWVMELWAHHAHITRYEKAAHDVWQRQYKTYTSLLELAERRWTALGTIAGRTDQYVEASHI